jgi:hypothetical protein
MEHTKHYHLSQWSMEDRIQMQDFNADNAKIDAALKAEAETRQAADTAQQAALNNHTAQITKLGNCQIYTAQYTGQGKTPVSHTFPHKPWLITVTCLEGGSMIFWQGQKEYSENKYVTYTWNGNTVTWGGPLSEGMAYPDRHYQIIALLDMEE